MAAWEAWETATEEQHEQWFEEAIDHIAREFRFNDEKQGLHRDLRDAEADYEARIAALRDPKAIARATVELEVLRGQRSPLELQRYGNITAADHQQDVVEDLGAGNALTTVVAAIGNLAHPRHLTILEQLSGTHYSRAVRVGGRRSRGVGPCLRFQPLTM